MMYVGNTSLSPQIQERILNTFQQTLSLAQEGNRQEALLGCDFVLRLDPLFEPARRLQQRLREADGAVDVHDFMQFGDSAAATANGASSEAGPEAVAVDETPLEVVADDAPLEAVPDEMPLEVVPDEAPLEVVADNAPLEAVPDEMPLEVVPDEAPLEVASDEAPGPPPGADSLPSRLAMLVEQRRFQDVLRLATEHKDRMAAESGLRQLVEVATTRHEAEPYVKNFLDSVRRAVERGDLEAARSHLEKARELDPTHPDIVALEADLAGPIGEAAPAPSSETEPATVDPSLDAEADAAPEIPDLAAEPLPSLQAEPAARLDSESEQRIAALLNEGQTTFEKGQYQSAIDAWSRIFLIDIDHAEASRRIELARKLKAEVERQVEEEFHEGISLLESGNIDGAREAMQKVIEMQPTHLGAREYLERLESGDLELPSAELPEIAPAAEPPPADIVPDALEGLEEIDLEPEPTDAEESPLAAEVPPVPMPAAEPAAAPGRRRLFALIGSAVLILVLLVAWLVYSKWDRIFPASTVQQAGAAQPRIDPVERARELHEAGNTAMAINVLRRLPPGHEQFPEAQSLIAMWEAGDQPTPPTPQGPSPADLTRREELIERARRVSGQGENLLALELLGQASSIAPLRGEEREIRMLATDRLEDLEAELELFKQGDWEYALPNLWRLHEAQPQNRDVVRLIVDSYYNLGLRDLQRGDPRAALEKLEEALELYPEDPGLLRLTEFAAAYNQRPTDLLYRIFVKYQHFR